MRELWGSCPYWWTQLLISRHFEDRYADQRWLIYDFLRKYGIYNNLKMLEEAQLSFSEQAPDGLPITSLYDESEDFTPAPLAPIFQQRKHCLPLKTPSFTCSTCQSDIGKIWWRRRDKFNPE